MGERPSTSAPASVRPTKTRFIVLAWLCAAAALAYVSRNAIAVAESTVRTDLGLTMQQSGWLMSAFFFSYALCRHVVHRYWRDVAGDRPRWLRHRSRGARDRPGRPLSHVHIDRRDLVPEDRTCFCHRFAG